MTLYANGMTLYANGDCVAIRRTRALGKFPVPVFVTNHTSRPMSQLDAEKIAERAVTAQIYFNDLTSRYWIYDFKVCGFWCEMRQPEDVSPFDEMHIHIYSAADF